MINSYQTSNGVSHLAKQTTDMAPINVDTTVVPTSLSNITRNDFLYVKSASEAVVKIPSIVLNNAMDSVSI